MADPHHQAVSSRLVKEIARLGGSAELFVPEAVHTKLLARYGTRKGK
jgi:pantetheine-phosphate adenylyltransferase